MCGGCLAHTTELVENKKGTELSYAKLIKREIEDFAAWIFPDVEGVELINAADALEKWIEKKESGEVEDLGADRGAVRQANESKEVNNARQQHD